MENKNFSELIDQGIDMISKPLKAPLGPIGDEIEKLGCKLGDKLSDFIDSLFESK